MDLSLPFFNGYYWCTEIRKISRVPVLFLSSASDDMNLIMAINMGAKGILFISHIGKFVKVAVGIMNTHSHNADARMETLCAAAIRCGCTLECAREVLDCNTTDEALQVLDSNHILKETMEEIMRQIQFYLDHHSYHQILLGAVVFSNEYGYLGQTADAGELINKISKGEK